MDSKLKTVSRGEGTVSYCISRCGPETKPLIPNPFRLPMVIAKIFPPKDVLRLRFFCLRFLLGKMRGCQLDLFCSLKTRGMLMGCPIWGPCLPALGADLSCSWAVPVETASPCRTLKQHLGLSALKIRLGTLGSPPTPPCSACTAPHPAF